MSLYIAIWFCTGVCAGHGEPQAVAFFPSRAECLTFAAQRGSWKENDGFVIDPQPQRKADGSLVQGYAVSGHVVGEREWRPQCHRIHID
jgi:hypothetical protein